MALCFLPGLDAATVAVADGVDDDSPLRPSVTDRLEGRHLARTQLENEERKTDTHLGPVLCSSITTSCTQLIVRGSA